MSTVIWSCGGEQSDTTTTTTATTDSVTVIDLASPLDFPLSLAGNFGELRPYHFHGGLDFNIKGTTGHAVHSVERGYVSAVEVSPWGYGRAVYVTHPAIGLVTVYGHLEAFSPKIEKLVEAEQIKKESFSVDISFTPDQIPVER
ncbi:MAG: peptidoglycan DD-metalloendopeptidase family protein [Muribaculaceae bacterium]|nr:peptidoglycan DD-metalloendopeptidase family protein [Muribaculaceae bacterium]